LACSPGENRYDFPPLPFPGRRGSRWTDEPTAYLAIWADRAIAVVVLHTVQRYGYYDRPDERGYVHLDEPGPVRGVGAVFVCGDYRRRGIGGRLVRAACAAESYPLETVPWAMPFSPAGAALAQALVPADRLPVSG
jgi:GNAT superfamily N-acetyltransferase